MSSNIHDLAPCPICGDAQTITFTAINELEFKHDAFDTSTGRWNPSRAKTCAGKLKCWMCDIQIEEYLDYYIDTDEDLTPLLNACIDKWNMMCGRDEERENVI